MGAVRQKSQDEGSYVTSRRPSRCLNALCTTTYFPSRIFNACNDGHNCRLVYEPRSRAQSKATLKIRHLETPRMEAQVFRYPRPLSRGFTSRHQKACRAMLPRWTRIGHTMVSRSNLVLVRAFVKHKPSSTSIPKKL